MTKTTENTALEIVSPADPKSGSDAFVFLPAGSARKDGLTFEPGDDLLAETGPVDIQMSEFSSGVMLSFADTATAGLPGLATAPAEPQSILIPVDGAMLPAETLASLLALPVSDAVLKTEAGASLASGGGSVYQDNMGERAAGLAAQDVLVGVEPADRDAEVVDTTGDGNFDTLGVTLDNYRGDLGLDDLQLVHQAAA